MVRGVAEHGPELDQYIAQYSKNWNFARIPLTAAAIMRVAMYEILYMPEIPAAAAINDAVEIAKKYEDEKVVSFINGILGAFVRAEFPEQGLSLIHIWFFLEPILRSLILTIFFHLQINCVLIYGTAYADTNQVT